MKNRILFPALAALVITLAASCKKTYTCTCTYGQGIIDWTGQVDATSKASAISSVQSDCTAGDHVTCN